MLTQLPDRVASSNVLSGEGHRLSLMQGERWFAVNTLPFAEARARRNLEQQRFRTFMPRRHKTVRHARKMTTVEAPFFPRYLCRTRCRAVSSRA